MCRTGDGGGGRLVAAATRVTHRTTPRAVVVTVSDGVAHGKREDASGDSVQRLLSEQGLAIAERRVVPDELSEIEGLLLALVEEGIELVVTTGGTGLGPRDVTPEATKRVIEREAPGLGELMRSAGLRKTPHAALARGLVGTRDRTLIVNLPGSPKGASESLEALLGVLPHALQLLAGDTEHARSPQASAHPKQSAETTGRVVATVVDADGEPPCHLGQRLVISGGRAVDGTLGCSEFDSAALEDAPAVSATGVPVKRIYEHELGRAHVFLEPVADAPKLAVVGATPVALELLRIGGALGYECFLVEPRAARVTAEHRAAASGGVVESVAEASLDGGSDLVHTDHDAAGVADALGAALEAGVFSIGIMGSRRHTASHLTELSERGFPTSDIERIESPVGLDIGARLPGEIAVSIAAWLIAERRRNENQAGSGPELGGTVK
jgi:molybdopterin adenylyltransferase